MKLTKHFTFEELTKSDYATKHGIDNSIPSEYAAKLGVFAACGLEPLREAFGAPIIVTSGWRCDELNEAIGGKPTSQHKKAEAADLVPAQNTASERRRLYMEACALDFDQVIMERNSKGNEWVHVSWKLENNRNIHISNYKA